MGHLPQAELCLRQLLQSQDDPLFSSTDPTLRGWRGRHELADVLLAQGKHAEARSLWELLVREEPGCTPAWMGLAEVALRTNDAVGLERVAKQLEALEGGKLEAELLRCRLMLTQGNPVGARARAEQLLAEQPNLLGARVLVARSLMVEGKRREAEEAFRAVLVLDPCHPEAREQIANLMRGRLRTEDAFFEERGQLTGWLLHERYQAACVAPTPLRDHLPALHELARECKHVTDVGTGDGLAATAFLWAQPETLILLDVVRSPSVERLEALAGTTRLSFRREDSLAADLEETDLLFLDATHDGEQLRCELERHAARVRRYLVLHGTTAYADRGESPRGSGLRAVMADFLDKGTFRVTSQNELGQGLTVLERVT